jgi:Contractile injection system tube protein
MDAISAIKLPFNFKILPTSEEGIPNGLPFLAMFNPENFTLTEDVDWNPRCPPGNAGTALEYHGTKARKFNIEITIDGTGVNTNGVKIPVPLQIALFRSATTTMNPLDHRPPFLIVQYGLFICKCVLTTSSVNYTMFDMFGFPIRAKITASFVERTPKSLGGILGMLSSPDLTHTKQVQEWDLLPLMTHQIYKKQEYYLQVAKVNRIKNFRKLNAGSTINFPPLSRSQKK